MHPFKNIAIIGAGPAGLFAAETLLSLGHKVTVYDRMPSPGRKLLMAGRGGLNLTHSEPLERFIKRYREKADWLEPYIRQFSPDDLRKWCEGLGQTTFIGSSGRVFPKAMKAAPLLRTWLKRLETLGVNFAFRHEWKGWMNDQLHFSNSSEKILVKPDATLLALGGASWPRLGSDGSWTSIFSEHNILVSPLLPANCGFTVPWSDYFNQRFAGTPLKSVTAKHGNLSQQGEIMITKKGLEGGVIYALSSELRQAIIKEGQAKLYIDLKPDLSHQALNTKLGIRRATQSFSSYLRKSGFLPVIIALLREVTSADELNNMSPDKLAATLKNLPLTLTGTTGLDRAISTSGGIIAEELDNNFMLIKKRGVFIAGEMLDWEAPTGGYLLQACFSTGIAAAKGMNEYLLKLPID